MLHTVYSSAVYTVICAFVSFTNIYWAPTMENTLISTWMFNPKRKSGSYVDKCSSKVQPQEAAWHLVSLLWTPPAGSRRKAEKQQFPKAGPLNQRHQHPLGRHANAQAAPDVGSSSSQAAAALGTGLSPRLDRTPKQLWWHWRLTATATNQPQSSERWAEWVPFFKFKFLKSNDVHSNQGYTENSKC